MAKPRVNEPQWTRALEFKVKDIREEPAETLWFVGDYAAFDPRNQKVSQTVARLLKAAGEDFGLLHEGEKTAGNDVRRVGEEGLYEELARHNIEQMTGAKPFKRIITTDPHSYNTIKTNIRASVPLRRFPTTPRCWPTFWSGRLKVQNPLNKRVTFHDPCHLGRLNGELRCTAAKCSSRSAAAHRDAEKSRQLILLWCWRWTDLDPRYSRNAKAIGEPRA